MSNRIKIVPLVICGVMGTLLLYQGLREIPLDRVSLVAGLCILAFGVAMAGRRS